MGRLPRARCISKLSWEHAQNHKNDFGYAFSDPAFPSRFYFKLRYAPRLSPRDEVTPPLPAPHRCFQPTREEKPSPGISAQVSHPRFKPGWGPAAHFLCERRCSRFLSIKGREAHTVVTSARQEALKEGSGALLTSSRRWA